MNRVVMDASVIIACILREPGYKNAESLLPYAIVSTINMAEVTTHFARNGFNEVELKEIITTLPVQTKAYDDSLVVSTGMLGQETKKFGLSLGDRACLSLGIAQNLPVITADKIWSKISLPIEVRVIR